MLGLSHFDFIPNIMGMQAWLEEQGGRHVARVLRLNPPMARTGMTHPSQSGFLRNPSASS